MPQKCLGSTFAKLNVKQTTGTGSELNNISDMQFKKENCSKQCVRVVILIACSPLVIYVQLCSDQGFATTSGSMLRLKTAPCL